MFKLNQAARTFLTAIVFCAAAANFAQAAEFKVGIDNFAFSPATLSIKPGDAVVFENHDDIPHLVVDVAGNYRSKAMDTNDKFAQAFPAAGEFAYFCGLHPHMKGMIIVAP